MPGELTQAGLNPVESLLSGVASSAVQSEDIYIGSQAFPFVDVDGVDFDGKLWLEVTRPFDGQRYMSLRRAANAEYAVIASGDPDTIDYLCEERGAASFIDTKTMKRSKYPDDLKDRELGVIRRAILDELERDASDLAFSAGNWGSNTVSMGGITGGTGSQFGQFGADEIADLALVLNQLEDTANNHRPNAMIIGKQAWNRLKTATSLRSFVGNDTNRTRFSDTALMELLKNSLELEFVYIGRARSETVAPDATSSSESLWVDNVLFYYKTQGGAVEMNGGARVGINTFMKVNEALEVDGEIITGENGVAIGGSQDIKKNPPGVEMIGASSWDLLLINNLHGFLVTDCVA